MRRRPGGYRETDFTPSLEYSPRLRARFSFFVSLVCVLYDLLVEVGLLWNKRALYTGIVGG